MEFLQKVRFEASLLVLGAVAALVLTAGEIFEGVGIVRYAATVVLFLIPGLLVWRWFFTEKLPGISGLPVAYVISTSIFALLAVPFLILHRDLGEYLVAAGVVLAGFTVAAVVKLARGGSDLIKSKMQTSWLWIPFAGLAGILAYLSRLAGTGLYSDMWVYLSWVREYLTTEHLALRDPYFGEELGISRALTNGWLVEQAALSRVSGIDSINAVLYYLNPSLVIVTLLAVYALARLIFKSQHAALMAGMVYALYYLTHFKPDILTEGGLFVERISEDKFMAMFIFLPVGLAAAFAFFESRKLRYLALFTFLVWAVLAIHPVGYAVLGLSMAGFSLFYLAVNWREGAVWKSVLSLGAAGGSALAVPALLVFAVTGEPLTTMLKDADINAHNPKILANMVFVRPERQRILEFGDGSYIMHPTLIVDPFILTALVLGVPFLLWRLKRHMGAQMLFGMLYLVTAAVYVPPVATFLGDHVVLPGQLWRMAWPIPLASLLILGWMAWDLVKAVQSFLQRRGQTVGRLSPLIVPVVMAAALVVAAPFALPGINASQQAAVANARGGYFPSDPALRWIQANINQPAVILAPDRENTRIPAYSGYANVMSLRGQLTLEVLPQLEAHAGSNIEVPQGDLAVRDFFSSQNIDTRDLSIIENYSVDYVMIYTDSILNDRLAERPQMFTPLDVPGERFSIYEVDYESVQEALGEQTASG